MDEEGTGVEAPPAGIIAYIEDMLSELAELATSKGESRLAAAILQAALEAARLQKGAAQP